MTPRIPKEPADSLNGFKFIPTLDFSKIGYVKGSDEYNEVMEVYMSDFHNQCKELHSGNLPWNKMGEKNGTICEKLNVAGTNIPLMKHTSYMNFPAKLVFRVCHSLTYSSVVDNYAFHVECKDIINTKRYDWAHVTWTVDNISPFFDVRDFCTLDFVHSTDMISMSKSVEHPIIPRTDVPSKMSGIMKKTVKSRSYRVPLVWFLKVIPLDDKNCKVVQVQWSDVGGCISHERICTSVEKFGYDSNKRLKKIVSHVEKRKLSTPGIKSPIIPSWNRDANKIIPGLDASYS